MDIVTINKCDDYNLELITEILHKQFADLGLNPTDFKDKNILIKPNLVMRATPDRAVTTHPTMIEAVCNIIIGFGGKVTLADSPGGLYTPAILKGFYKACGLTDVAERTGAILNYDISYTEIPNPDGQIMKTFNFLAPVCNADYIINICKLKTHSYTIMSGAVKNLYGCIPGTQKFEIHARFNKRQNFFSMLNDLCSTIYNMKPMINIVDAVIGMEGNGPSGGSPRKIGCILSAENPFALDLVNAKLLNLENIVPYVEISKQRGYCSEVEIIGDDINSLIVHDYKKPDTARGKKFEMIPSFISARPVVDPKKCVACLDCINSCPVNTIKLAKNKKAFIIRKNCIKCYCCQELCKYKAIKIKRFF